MGAIQNSINYALGTAAIAAGLTNKKQAEKAQDKLDDTKDKLAKTEAENKDLSVENKDLSAENKEKSEILSATKDEQNMQYGLNAYDVSNDLPTAKATNVDANDKIDVISNNSINPSIGSSMNDYLNTNKKVDPYVTEQIMGFHALKMSDSMVAAKKAVGERIKSRRAMISERARAARENGGNK